MILATMILLQQPLTLPGLAGVVLTLGMAVDANVLVFERMREERAKGSTPRMAIRNGFDRAFYNDRRLELDYVDMRREFCTGSVPTRYAVSPRPSSSVS